VRDFVIFSNRHNCSVLRCNFGFLLTFVILIIIISIFARIYDFTIYKINNLNNYPYDFTIYKL